VRAHLAERSTTTQTSGSLPTAKETAVAPEALPALLTFRGVSWSVPVKKGKVTQSKQILKGVTGIFEVRHTCSHRKARAGRVLTATSAWGGP
jgi:hypothetical protein